MTGKEIIDSKGPSYAMILENPYKVHRKRFSTANSPHMFTGRAETQIVKRVWVDPGDLINSCAVAPSNGQSWERMAET
jgi:hypothetical protein